MKFIKLSLVAGTALALAACASETETDDSMMADETAMAEEATAPGTIVEVAQGDEDTFSTLVAAVTAAGLGDALSGEGPLTVFAPTNDAFGALPEGTVENLTTNDTETLGAILQYHVVEGRVDAATLIGMIEAAGEEGHPVPTLGGGELTATLVDGGVVLTDATGATVNVTATDVEASNGLIHVIDGVLMPQ
ncbi:beta-Ig-H3/fasciclin [Erythrobacter sp. KY5]|uniref:fasciclin domain-containing protein n=1 Tax=Erythrobacter sp. KY5 TaxID=2011159 RepID=UPI000DBEFA64|nr:fasciclin domain-containing protein [Erythrobacter sp. KY5]AWW75692.1 beta-Ig-H3/fasciclin [Erythrobacter sp. KY5]